MRRLKRFLALLFWMLLALILIGSSARPNRGSADAVHRFTAPIEFDFAGWTVGAIGVKLAQTSRADVGYLRDADRISLVREYLSRLEEAGRLQREIDRVYADPSLADPQEASAGLRMALAEERRGLEELQPAAEAVLEEQASVVVVRSGLAGLGAPIPPVSFHLSKLPMALVISPRDVIRQEALIQLLPDLELDQQISLERAVEDDLGVSAVVVPIGGIGTYPTMVQETTALSWLSEVVIHEWVHNFLTLRPLGWAYESSPETRTMNETAASLVGDALGRSLLERYYPDLVPPPAAPATATEASEPPAFDFNAEMHATRLEVDRLLAEGRVDEAEAYMEVRRRDLVDHGYVIRRLNQAYFAFHGAYADEDESAAGADPVGEAVRELWAVSGSPAAFLRRIAGMNDYGDLLASLGRSTTSP